MQLRCKLLAGKQIKYKKVRDCIAGLVGVVPAYGLLEPPVVFNSGQLILWSLALAFIGVFCAVPLRHQTILKEKLKFPSGLAKDSQTSP